jgi:redox-sensitive bicupin YhaK (pirin superfamily)
VAHADSAGHSGVLHAGDVQWMTAGTGVVHREMPSEKMQIEGGVMHGFQLWVNLPRTHKNIPPRYQEVASDSITEVVHQNGLARVRVIAGSVLGVDSVIQTHVPILYLHVILQKEGKQSFNIPQGFRVGVYVFEGDMDVCGSQVGKGQFCILSEGDKCDLSSTSSGTQALVLGGIPIQEPIAWGGPFVMNTREEVMEAYRDFQEGRMGHISPEIIRA